VNAAAAPPRQKNAGLRVIALIKIGKGLLLTGIGLGFFHSINHDLGETMRKIAYHLRIDPENRMFRLLIEKIADISPKTLRTYGLVSLLFAAELFAEGVGLWLNQAWAKYLVVVATAAFIPEEIRACIAGFRWEKLGILAVNLAVLIYVVILLGWRRRPAAAQG
jgi:uncharacterized membrane protein (DUF2068 family)